MKSLIKYVEEKTRKNGVKCSHVASIVLIALIAIGTLGVNKYSENKFFGIENLILLKQEQIVDKNGPIPGCNLFSGKWVYDNVSYPLYKEEECSFVGYKFPACKKYGRKDMKYLNWRWQPHHCDIPRFNGSALVEKLRGKTILFVGDSISRNQWESMFCLIKSHLPQSSHNNSWKQETEDNLYKFYSTEYNITMGHYWSPYLVESNCDKAFKFPRTIKIKSIEKHGRQWVDADFLVFDTYAWWKENWMMLLWGSFEKPDATKFLERTPRIYEIALSTWSDWLEMQIDPNKTKMFFMSPSPYHFGPTLENRFTCKGHEEPIFDEKYWPNSVNRKMMEAIESVIEKLEQKGVKVEYINVTQLSGYRIDAHPSIYLSTNPVKNYSDCLHWCLPGLPDIWNQILYTYIMKS